jgi:hypothetical protein
MDCPMENVPIFAILEVHENLGLGGLGVPHDISQSPAKSPYLLLLHGINGSASLNDKQNTRSKQILNWRWRRVGDTVAA